MRLLLYFRTQFCRSLSVWLPKEFGYQFGTQEATLKSDVSPYPENSSQCPLSIFLIVFEGLPLFSFFFPSSCTKSCLCCKKAESVTKSNKEFKTVARQIKQAEKSLSNPC